MHVVTSDAIACSNRQVPSDYKNIISIGHYVSLYYDGHNKACDVHDKGTFHWSPYACHKHFQCKHACKEIHNNIIWFAAATGSIL